MQKGTSMTVAMILLIILISFLMITLGICLYAYRIAFYAPKRINCEKYTLPQGEQYEVFHPNMTRCIEKMLALPYEDVHITSFDNKKLYGRYYHVADNAPVQILFHGYKSNPYIDFSGGNLLARKMGHNTLVIDQRSHGKSEGSAISFGINERKDCLYWVKYVNERFGEDTPIILCGLSMGAATVLMAADLDLPENVVGIIADCPYSSPKAIIRKVCRDMHFPPRLLYPFVRLSALLFAGFQLEESNAVSAVRKTNIPILLIHGEDDRFVPCDMSREIAAACASPITFVTIPGAGHGLSYMVSPKEYEEATIQFIESVISS